MKKIFLYEGRYTSRRQTDLFVIVDDEDFEQLNKYEWGLMKIYHTENKIFYARRYEWNAQKRTLKAILMHRTILNISDKGQKGDHKDGNGLNNQRSNLRIATHSQNMSNRKNRGNSSSIYFGVHKYKTPLGKIRYNYTIKHNKEITIKHGFISEDIAALERNKKAMELKGEYATLNVITWY